MAIEQMLDGGKALSGFISSIRDRLSGAISGDLGTGRARVVLEVEDADLRRAEESMDRLEQRQERQPVPAPLVTQPRPAEVPSLVAPDRTLDVPSPIRPPEAPGPSAQERRFSEQPSPSERLSADWGSPSGLPEESMDRLEQRQERQPVPAPLVTQPRPAEVPSLVAPDRTLDVPSPIRPPEAPGPSAQERRFSEQPSPTAWRSADWGSPSGLPEDRATAKAETLWGQIREGGAVGTLRSVGGFGAKWGGALGEESKGEMQGWLTAAARGEGQRFLGAMDDVEKIGGKIARLTKEMESAGTQAEKVKIADVILGLTKRLDELGASAGKAADAIGGEKGVSLRAEMEKTVDSAKAGQMAPEESRGRGLLRNMTPERLMGILRNPIGGLQSLAGDAMAGGLGGQGLLAALKAPTLGGAFGALGGGALGAGAMAAAGGGALAAGFGAGWAINSKQADDAVADGTKALRDVQLSQGLGAGFDLRGAAWKTGVGDDRLQFDPALAGVNYGLARQSLQQFNVGFGRWSGAGDDRTRAQELFRTADDVQRRAIGMGVEGGALSQFVGAQMRAGEVDWSRSGLNKGLDRVAGLLEEANRTGVSSNEKLGVLASLRQQQESRAGYVSADGIKVTENLSRLFDQSGVAALRGQSGMNAMNAIGTGNELWNSLLIGRSVAGGELTKQGQQIVSMLPKEQVSAAREQGYGWIDIIEKAMADPAVQTRMKQQFLQSDEGKKLPAYVRGQLLGTMSAGLTGMTAESVLARGGDLATMGGPSPAKGATGQAGKESAVYYGDIAERQKAEDERLKTTRSLDSIGQTIAANSKIGSELKEVQQKLWHSTDSLVGAVYDLTAAITGGPVNDPGNVGAFLDLSSGPDPRRWGRGAKKLLGLARK